MLRSSIKGNFMDIQAIWTPCKFPHSFTSVYTRQYLSFQPSTFKKDVNNCISSETNKLQVMAQAVAFDCSYGS
jgi:hypothetical protein